MVQGMRSAAMNLARSLGLNVSIRLGGFWGGGCIYGAYDLSGENEESTLDERKKITILPV